MLRLESIELSGFKTIRELRDFKARPLNVMIGANGAGKSNFISFFRMLSWMTAGSGQLQDYLKQVAGGANALLFNGAERTPRLLCKLNFETERGMNEYELRLSWAAGDRLIIAHERLRFSDPSIPAVAPWTELGAGQWESGLTRPSSPTVRFMLGAIQRLTVFQFHNTSPTAKMRQNWSEHDNLYLREDGGNIAPFLLGLRDRHPECFDRITHVVRLVSPLFSEFVLSPEANVVMLRWRERGTDQLFAAHQAPDGWLRFVCLAALLLQPDPPPIILLDEPELGLHPYAVDLLAEVLSSVQTTSQIFLCTQSPVLVDRFDPEDIVVVERDENGTTFQRLESARLEDWLSEYSLGALWRKSVFAGGPQA